MTVIKNNITVIVRASARRFTPVQFIILIIVVVIVILVLLEYY